jgi:carbamoyl-phosphate synthase large subunit
MVVCENTIMLKGKRVFVSGGNGVIGNALVDALYHEGAIILVGDLKPRPPNWPGEILYRQGDLNYITKAELDEFEPELFFHLAATFERSTETYEFWDENRRHNVQLSTHLMSILKESRPLKKVVFASSYLVYDKTLYTFGSPAKEVLRLRESDPIVPRNLTGAAKLNHEIELRFLREFKKHQFNIVSARIFRSYGRNSRDVIGRWVRALLNNEEIVVYRKEGLFDYICAEDVAEGLIQLACAPEASGAVNLGRGRARRVGDVVEVLKRHFPSMKYREEEHDIPYEASEADMSRFLLMTGWQPAQDLETTIPKLIDYERQVLNGKQSQSPSFNVLVTSISNKVPLLKAVKNAVMKLGSETTVIGGDSKPDAVGKYFVDQYWHMPHASDENRSVIIEFIRKNNIRAVIPTRDGELLFWSHLKKELPDISVLVSNAASVKLCLDKLMFWQELHTRGFPVIHTAENIHDLSTIGNVVVKERFGAGSVNMMLNLSREEAVAHAAKLSRPIFQPFVEGTEYSVDVYVSRSGKAKGGIVRSRDVVVSGEAQITTTVEKVDILDLCIRISETMHLYGHVVFQIIQQGTTNHIVECNSRFGGASTLSVSAGLDSFYWFLLESIGADIAEYPFVPCKTTKRQIRFPEDLILS